MFSVRSNYLKFHVLNVAKTRILVLQHMRMRRPVGGHGSLKIYFLDLRSIRKRKCVFPKRLYTLPDYTLSQPRRTIRHKTTGNITFKFQFKPFKFDYYTVYLHRSFIKL